MISFLQAVHFGRSFGRTVRIVLFCSILSVSLKLQTAPAIDTDDEDAGNGIVTCQNGLLEVNAREIRTEDLMKEIGEKCGIKIVVYGEVFSEVPISIRFQNMPVRKGIERVLRGADITNHLMHFKDTDNGTHMVELDLIGEKGGERYLTHAATPKDSTEKKPSFKNRLDRADESTHSMTSAEEQKLQENFLKIMDEVLSSQLEEGVEPDPSEILKMFKEVVPPEMKDQIPQEVLEELEKLE